MSSSPQDADKGPDLTQGIDAASVPADGMFAGHVGDDPVVLARVEGAIVAVAGACTHYGGPLKDGLRVGRTVTCPWHHACFDLATGVALEAPALSPLDRWKVEEAGGRVFVREKLPAADEPTRDKASDPKAIVIVGGGAAGFAATQRLRDLGYAGDLILISADGDAPYDRPNVSKDYLAGEADPAWMPLKDEAFYRNNRITVRTATRVVGLDAPARRLTLEGGETLGYDRLLLATGATPIRLSTPGFDRDNVHVLRSLADGDQLIAAAEKAKAVAVIGASFIGLEVAGSLRTRGLTVHVIAPETLPFESTLGPQVGAFIKRLHEEHGVRFHLGRTAKRYDGARIALDDGSTVDADLVVVGVGVRPSLELAEAAGLKIDKGVVVDRDLRTSDPAIFAAGDIARYPEPATGALIRVEHWVVAERQGQAAAAAMLGVGEPLADPPFFWTAHYGCSIRYVGHADSWDRIEEIGEVANADGEVRLVKDGRAAAVVTIGRDMASLKAAQAMRQESRGR
jgi:NADPH-dependent 2,4-dienoyl-CoA reductase/sulfur reductase-like enzyme/nitrite reductase/ring-hydroxylating ferredoxin subunit